MSEYKRLDDIERREHRDLRMQWFVATVLMASIAAVVVAMASGP
jgi:hypothetical protein